MKIYIADEIKELEPKVLKHKEVLNAFPNAVFDPSLNFYADNSVNKIFTHLEFEQKWKNLVVYAYVKIPVLINNVQEEIKVYALPYERVLVHITWDRAKIYFNKFPFNIRKHNYIGDIKNDIRKAFLTFVTNNPNVPIDDSNLTPEIKKLILII